MTSIATARVVARSLREVARGGRVDALLLPRSQDLVCRNLMCEHVGSSCACKLALVLERVPMLREIDLAANQLRVLPEPLFALTQLTHLDASSNQLTSIPSEISQLRALEVLDLSHNQLQQLPDGDVLAGLPRLTELRVTGNPLKEEEIEQLRALRVDLTIME